MAKHAIKLATQKNKTGNPDSQLYTPAPSDMINEISRTHPRVCRGEKPKLPEISPSVCARALTTMQNEQVPVNAAAAEKKRKRPVTMKKKEQEEGGGKQRRLKRRTSKYARQLLAMTIDQPFQFYFTAMGNIGQYDLPLRWYVMSQRRQERVTFQQIAGKDRALLQMLRSKAEPKDVCAWMESSGPMTVESITALVDYQISQLERGCSSMTHVSNALGDIRTDPLSYMRSESNRYILGVNAVELCLRMGMTLGQLYNVLHETITVNHLNEMFLPPEYIFPKCDAKACAGADGLSPFIPPLSSLSTTDDDDDDDDEEEEEEEEEESDDDDDAQSKKKKRVSFARAARRCSEMTTAQIHVIPVYLVPMLMSARFFRRFWPMHFNRPSEVVRSIAMRAEAFYKRSGERSCFDVSSVGVPRMAADTIEDAAEQEGADIVRNNLVRRLHYRWMFAQLFSNADMLEQHTLLFDIRSRVATLESLFSIIAEHACDQPLRDRFQQAIAGDAI